MKHQGKELGGCPLDNQLLHKEAKNETFLKDLKRYLVSSIMITRDTGHGKTKVKIKDLIFIN